MKKFLVIYKSSLQKAFLEKEVVFVWSLSSAINLLVIITVWLSSNRVNIGGFTKSELLTYYFSIFMLEQVVGWWVFWDMRKIIRDGTISNFILKPFGYLRYLFVSEFGFKSMSFGTHLLVGSVIYLIFQSYLDLSVSSLQIVKIVPAILIGIGINFLTHFSMGCTTFFWTESFFVANFHWMTVLIFGGHLVPLSFFKGEILKIIINFNPFRYTFAFPAEILSGKFDETNYFTNLLIGTIWVALLFILAKVIWRTGLRKYSAYGS